jgi:peptidoglycan/xylan/chitin deacetylase (PgdA/CDA1 family)
MTPGSPALGATLRSRAVEAAPEAVLEPVRLAVARRLERRLRGSRAARGAALVFHAVAPRAGDPDHEIEPAVAVERLDAVIGHLAGRYALVRASELPAAVRARAAGDRVPIAVTFDDDLASHRKHAAPVLRRHGAIATAFLCGATEPFWWQLLQAAVDRRAIAEDALPHVDRDLVRGALERRPAAAGRLAKVIEDLRPAERDRVAAVLAEAVPDGTTLLGPEGAAALARAGWEIGFHTRRHDLLTTLGEAAMRAALRRAGAARGARAVAYPHGKATEREARAAREAGYVAAYTGRAEVLPDRTDDHLIGRLQPDTSTPGRFALDLARALSRP